MPGVCRHVLASKLSDYHRTRADTRGVCVDRVGSLKPRCSPKLPRCVYCPIEEAESERRLRRRDREAHRDRRTRKCAEVGACDGEHLAVDSARRGEVGIAIRRRRGFQRANSNDEGGDRDDHERRQCDPGGTRACATTWRAGGGIVPQEVVSLILWSLNRAGTNGTSCGGRLRAPGVSLRQDLISSTTTLPSAHGPVRTPLLTTSSRAPR